MVHHCSNLYQFVVHDACFSGNSVDSVRHCTPLNGMRERGGSEKNLEGDSNQVEGEGGKEGWREGEGGRQRERKRGKEREGGGERERAS